MTDQEQFDAMNTRQWYTDMRTQAGAILVAMDTTGFRVTDGWINTTVSGVPTRFKIGSSGKTVLLEAGLAANGEPVFSWEFPLGWVS